MKINFISSFMAIELKQFNQNSRYRNFSTFYFDNKVLSCSFFNCHSTLESRKFGYCCVYKHFIINLIFEMV